MRAKSPEASDKATQQGLLPVEINTLEKLYFLLQRNAEFFVLTSKLGRKKIKFQNTEILCKSTVLFLQPTLYGPFLKNIALFKIKLKDYLELSCINTSQVSV